MAKGDNIGYYERGLLKNSTQRLYFVSRNKLRCEENKSMSQKGHITGLAGEFHVMEQLFRLGHEATLTLGNAKAIDILTRSPAGNLYEVDVKAIRGGGKWGIGNHDYSMYPNLVFVLLHYREFEDLRVLPEAWVVPAIEAEKIKLPWHNQYGLYIYKEHQRLLEQYRDAWQYLA